MDYHKAELNHLQWRTEGGSPPPRNSEVLTKSNRIAH